MTMFLDWWRRDKRDVTLLKSVLLALLPLVCCLAYCAAQGRSLGEVYLPCSEWNDELFYYKQVEGMVKFGYPRGYFGFNESHALKLSFAAWSPVLVFPWILWGLVFGWNLLSPVICNILLMSLTCFAFVWLVKPSWRQLGVLTLLFCLFTPFVRYMLSVMPEVICFSLLIVFYSLAVNYLRGERAWKLALLFALSAVLTLMRPYMLLFLLLPAYLWVRRNGWRGAAGSAAVVGATLGLYGAVKHYLGAEYFAPLFFTDWAEAFFEQGFLEGLRFTAGKLAYMGRDFWAHTVQGFRTGLCSGAYFAGYAVCALVLLGQSAADARALKRLRAELKAEDAGAERTSVAESVGGGKASAAEKAGKEKALPGGKTDLNRDGRIRELGMKLTVETHLFLSFVGMFFALLLMYKLTEGSKHLLTFMAAAVFTVSIMETRFFKKAVLLGATFGYFYTVMAADPYDYQVPFVREERRAAVESWERELAESMALSEEAPSYENAVIWVFNDMVGDKAVNTDWQLLYALPEGFGISCCMRDYVAANFDSLRSRYLCVVPGGEIEGRCEAAGYERLAESPGAVLFQRY